ncbi:hypothetical protein K504DRAFT_476956 [Pleomassaria siparia CBS 279.74]|uniref:Glycosyl transferase CAP10 domain-containing protein n=1 Tax=Pleomassaria siparia CBS 279.74 TaxID=1314801 RepID=A0A6G1KB86_9PLEO|nr:hypothetical protein K504DRAFT_476956 [Pleomassaria siparia CBS 279.74]
MLDCLTYFLTCACAVIILLVCAILYGTRAQHPHIPAIVKGVLPAGRCLCEYSATFTCDTCLDCASTQPISLNHTTAHDWAFSYRRDGGDYGLREDQCQVAFPGLFEDIQRAKKFRQRREKITERELSSWELTKGMVRAMIYNGELHILETFLVDNVNREKAISALSAIHRAVVSAPEYGSVPNIEFIFSVEDLPAEPQKPLWVLARRANNDDLWLIPDFGFWSWDVQQLGAFSEVAAEAIQREVVEPWDQKKEKLVWRGKMNFAPKLRHALLDATRGKSWSDVGQVQWDDPDFKAQFVGPVDQCNYMFIAHAEGRSYSGSLKYRQLCRSVVVSHKLQWIQHHHYLMKSDGPNQNFVEVERDFSDLSAAMDDLLAHPEKAKRIADNNVQVFRERYLTGAAEACYWRALFKAWKEVSFEPMLYNGVQDGEKHSRGQKRGVRWETFMLYQPSRQMDFPKSAKVAPST